MSHSMLQLFEFTFLNSKRGKKSTVTVAQWLMLKSAKATRVFTTNEWETKTIEMRERKIKKKKQFSGNADMCLLTVLSSLRWASQLSPMAVQLCRQLNRKWSQISKKSTFPRPERRNHFSTNILTSLLRSN